MLAAVVRGALMRLSLLSPDWPDWAIDTFVLLSFGCVLLVGVQWLYDRRFQVGDTSTKAMIEGSSKGTATANKFRR